MAPSLSAKPTTFSTPSTFEARTAKSSNENVLTATATSSAPVNDYTFQVASLVATRAGLRNLPLAKLERTAGLGDLDDAQA